MRLLLRSSAGSACISTKSVSGLIELTTDFFLSFSDIVDIVRSRKGAARSFELNREPVSMCKAENGEEEQTDDEITIPFLGLLPESRCGDSDGPGPENEAHAAHFGFRAEAVR